MTVKRLALSMLIILLILGHAVAEKPFLKIIDLANTPKDIKEALQASWNVTVKNAPIPEHFHGAGRQYLLETVDTSIPSSVKQGAVLIIAKGFVFVSAEYFLTNIDKIPGVDAILDPEIVENGPTITRYSRNHKYAIVLVKEGFVVSHHSENFLNFLANLKNNLAESPRTPKKVETQPGAGGVTEVGTKTGEKKASSHISIGAPPTPVETMENFEEDNYAIPLPPGVHAVKIMGRPYPVKKLGGATVAIIPKDEVPKYYKIVVNGVCAEIRPIVPGAKKEQPNGICADYTYATLCAWSSKKDGNVVVSLGAMSSHAGALSYDLYVPKSVARDTKQIKGQYITIISDPVLRIYFKIAENNVAVKTIQISGASREFAPKGVLSFGACDVSVQELNIIKMAGKNYEIQFQIADKSTPVYADNVNMTIDGKIIIPQRDNSILGYRATVRLPDGPHRVIVSASVPGCGEIRYMKEFYTGTENLLPAILGILAAVVIAYILVKMVNMWGG